MKILIILFLCLFFVGCEGKKWFHKNPYYCLVFVNQSMVNEDGSPAPDKEQLWYKLKKSELPKFKDLLYQPAEGPFNSDPYPARGYYIIKGPFPPIMIGYWEIFVNDPSDDSWSLIRTEIKTKKEAKSLARDITNTLGFKTKIQYFKN